MYTHLQKDALSICLKHNFLHELVLGSYFPNCRWHTVAECSIKKDFVAQRLGVSNTCKPSCSIYCPGSILHLKMIEEKLKQVAYSEFDVFLGNVVCEN